MSAANYLRENLADFQGGQCYLDRQVANLAVNKALTAIDGEVDHG